MSSMKAAPATAMTFRPADDPLFRLELSVARRADELSRQSPCKGSARRARETWDRAERELLAPTFAPHGGASPAAR